MNTMAMLHSVAFDSDEDLLFLAELPGSTPPMKFHTVPAPPESNMSECSGLTNPPPLQAQWSATALLTPFYANDLQTANVEFNSEVMYIALQNLNGIKEYLNVENETYIIQNTSCLGPYNYGWVTPPREWLSSRKCECKGSLDIADIQTKAWRCPIYKTVDWYWFQEDNNNTWRMFFNNQTNPSQLPVLGEFAMVHFASYGTSNEILKTAYNNCIKEAKGKLVTKVQSHPVHSDIQGTSLFLKGFSYNGCADVTILPSWPQRFYMTVTMLPVLPGLENPLPTSVVYDWQRQSQCTMMCEPSLIYNAYLIINNTYILNQDLGNGTIECLSDLKFGPIKPNWMTLDNCKCMGTITENFTLSPWHFTAIATCPLIGDRVFWAWFTNDTGYSPLLFAETLTPPDEGTGLAMADYHRFYSKDILIDLQDFEVPLKCLHNNMQL